MTKRTRTVETLAPWIAGLLLACPVLVAYYPPMTDLPYHEAAISILRHFDDRSMFPPGLYVHNLGEPNQLFHMLGWALSYVVSTRWAVKLLVAAAVLAIPVCAARFASHVGASRLSALVVAPMTLGWLFAWGLITNLVGLAALLAMLPVADKYAAQPSLRHLAASLGAVVLLYFAHEAMMFVFAGTALWLAVIHPWSPQKTASRLVPFAACMAIAIGQAWWQKHLMTAALRRMPVIWHSVLHKVVRIPYIIVPATDIVVQTAMSALALSAIVFFFWLRARERRALGTAPPAAASQSERLRSWALNHRWELLAIGGLIAYFAFPFTLNGATLVYQRWFPPAFAILVVAAAPADLWTRRGRLPRLVTFALPAATLLVAWPSFADSGREHRALEELAARIEPGSAIADLELGPGDPTRAFSLGPAAGRILATRGGRLDYAFTDSSVSPVVVARRYQWEEALIRLGFDSWAFRPDHDFKMFRYVLLRSSDPNLIRLVTFALAPDARYVAEAGEWVLLESRRPVIPLVSPEPRMPAPPPDTLRERLARVLAALRQPGATPNVPAAPAPDPGAVRGQHF